MNQFVDPKSIRSIDDLKAEYEKVLLIADPYVVKMLMAAVIANRMDIDPVWLFLVAGPSGGKTEFINAIEGLPFIYPIDTLTANSFASGQKKAGKETSLLMKLDGGEGIFTFKDFTTILDMNPLARAEIMGQLRSIYDRKFTKRTGTGDDIVWDGKVGLIAAVTSIIHEKSAEFASMGERFIQYAIKQPDTREVQRRKFLNADSMDMKRNHLKECTTEFIMYVLANIEDVPINVSPELQEEIFDIADFATLARSSVVKNNRTGLVSFLPDREMPTRVTTQLIGISKALIAINKTDPKYMKGMGEQAEFDTLRTEDMAILVKTCLDSIPRKRRQAIQALAKYKQGITTAGLAISLNYPSETMKETLFELNALGLCTRTRDGGVDKWKMVDVYKKIAQKFEKIEEVDAELNAEDSGEEYAEINTEVSETMKEMFGSADIDEDDKLF